MSNYAEKIFLKNKIKFLRSNVGDMKDLMQKNKFYLNNLSYNSR